MQEIFSAKEFYNADEAYVVSNHTYTSSARQLATSVGVQLIHHEELKRYSKIMCCGSVQNSVSFH